MLFDSLKQQQRECQARLPEEPSETEKNITQLKIRLPDGEGVLLRRFRIADNLQVRHSISTSAVQKASIPIAFKGSLRLPDQPGPCVW